MSSDLKNSKVWFITGTTSGLGKALTEAVLASGQRVVATARRPEALAYLKEKYSDSQLLIQKVDVSVPNQIKVAFENVRSHFGRLDVVVNNAGYAVVGEVEATSDEDARSQFEAMFWGPVNVSKEAISLFRDVNPGTIRSIFNISTVGGYSANPTLAFYNSSKFALEGFTEAFHKELLPEWNLRAAIIQPGGFETEWAGGSMIVLPQHPAYADPNGTASQFRAMLSGLASNSIGVPARAAQAILKLAEEPELPLRIQLGSDSLALIKFKASKTLQDAEKWAGVAHSTNKDGVDGEAYMQQILITLS